MLVALALSCSSPGRQARDDIASGLPLADTSDAGAIIASAPNDAGRNPRDMHDANDSPEPGGRPSALAETRAVGPELWGLDNPFVSKRCPRPKTAGKGGRGSSDQSTSLTSGLMQTRLEIEYELGDPLLPKEDLLEFSPAEEESFCGVVVAIDGDEIRIGIEGPQGPEERVVFVKIDPPLSLPFGVGSAVVVHGREEVRLSGDGRQLSIMITDERGRLLLSQAEGAADRFAPGFHVWVPQSRVAKRARRSPKSESRPPALRPEELYIARGGVRAVSKENWRVLATKGERFAVWGIRDVVGEKNKAYHVMRLRIVRLLAPMMARDKAVQCTADRWGGWQGSNECRAWARRRIRAADRSCQADADCALLGTACESHAVSSAATSRYESWPAPCTPPGGGNCSGPEQAICDQGCCVPAISGLAR